MGLCWQHTCARTHAHTHINTIAYSVVTCTGSCTHAQEAEIADMPKTCASCRYHRLKRCHCAICEDDFKGKMLTLSFSVLQTLAKS